MAGHSVASLLAVLKINHPRRIRSPGSNHEPDLASDVGIVVPRQIHAHGLDDGIYARRNLVESTDSGLLSDAFTNQEQKALSIPTNRRRWSMRQTSQMAERRVDVGFADNNVRWHATKRLIDSCGDSADRASHDGWRLLSVV